MEPERERSHRDGSESKASVVGWAVRRNIPLRGLSHRRVYRWKLAGAAFLIGCILGFPRVAGSAAAGSPVVVTRPGHDSEVPERRPAIRRVHPARPAHSKRVARRRTHDPLGVRSKIALVEDAGTSQVLYSKQPDMVVPIASITKLMTAMVVLDAHQAMDEMLKVDDADVDRVKFSTSRLHVGWSLSREDMLHLALMASENRAASALSRYYPGGQAAFLQAMNAKAHELGMEHTHFISPNGLTKDNVSTASDLVKLVKASNEYPLIREFSTDTRYDVRIGRHHLAFINTNRLVGRPNWDIQIQKTGYIRESGDCLVMQANVYGRELIMVFLDAYGKLTRFADARRVKLQLASVLQSDH
jgi:serine-type D-Ala-D-Ala endopeptidase (penicillin-binding protein 7)